MQQPHTKPDWAAPLPELRELQYVQALLTVAGLLIVAAWIAFAVVRDPRAAMRIGRKNLGA